MAEENSSEMESTPLDPTVPQFTKLAKYYDLLYGGKDYSAEAAVYERWLAPAHYLSNYGSRNTLIEFGCGTGNFGSKLASDFGWKVSGIDASPEMAAIANQKWVAARVGRLESLTVDHETWNAAIATFSVMSYCLAKPEDIAPALQNVNRCLHEGGRFVFDITSFMAALTSMRPVEERTVDDGQVQVHRKQRKQLDLATSLLRYEMEFKVTSLADGLAVDEWREVHILRTFTPAEISTLLMAAGFKVLFIGTLDGQAGVEADDWEIFVAAEKIRAA
jgi:SAM-dependent methyltransferase